MSDDLGKGDVVEALFDMPLHQIVKGARATVAETGLPVGRCWSCERVESAFLLEEYPVRDPRCIGWCRCGWRRIGGGQADTVRKFAADTQIPEWAQKVAKPLPVGSFRRVA